MKLDPPVFWQDCTFRLGRCYRHRVPQEGTQGSFYPESLTAWRIYSGKAEIVSSDGTLKIMPGHWVFLPPTPRVHRIEPETELLSIHFRLEWPDKRAVFDLRPGLVINTANTGSLDRKGQTLHRKIKSVFGSYPRFMNTAQCSLQESFQIHLAFISWLSEAALLFQEEDVPRHQPGKIDVRAMRVRQWLENLPLHQILVPQALAKEMGMSVSQINRIFTAAYDLTPTQYHDNHRFQAARSRLLKPNASIKTTASELGFPHLSKFSNWFTRHESLSPRAFIRKLHTQLPE